MSTDSTPAASPVGGDPGAPPFKPYETILEQEVEQAERELRRPAAGLFLSGLLAGFGIGIGVVLAAILLSRHGAAAPSPGMEVLLAAAYATGFVLVIMGHTDLFTEYTTMAILPVLMDRAGVAELGRLWGVVYVANLVGAAAFAGVAVVLAQNLGLAEGGTFARLARDLVGVPAWVMLLSATLSGWLMGLLSWLLSAARDSVSQILFIVLVAGAIGLMHLHHSIGDAVKLLAGVLTAPDLTPGTFGRFLLWATLGNVLGGVVFAVLLRFSVVIGGPGGRARRERGGGARPESDRHHGPRS